MRKVFMLALSVALLSPAMAAPYPVALVASQRTLSFHSRPVLSPDGRWLAYGIHRPKGTDRALKSGLQYRLSYAPTGTLGERVVVTELVSGRTLEVGGDTSFRPAWSPDGHSLAFYQECGQRVGLFVWTAEAGSHEIGQLQVHPRRATGDQPIWLGNDQVVVGLVLPEDRAWLPELDRRVSQDSPRVLKTGQASLSSMWTRAERVQPTRVDVRTGQANPLPQMPATETTMTFVSASGQRVAYLSTFRMENQEPVSDLVVGWLDGSKPWVRVKNLDVIWGDDDRPIQWHPNLDRLFLRAGRKLIEVDLSTGGLTAKGQVDYDFAFSADGRSIFSLQTQDTVRPSWSSPSRTPRSLLQIPLDGSPPRTFPIAGFASEILEIRQGTVWQKDPEHLRLLRTLGHRQLVDLGLDGSTRVVAELEGPTQLFGVDHGEPILKYQTPTQPPELGRWRQGRFQPLSHLEPELDHLPVSKITRFATTFPFKGQSLTVHTNVRSPEGKLPPAIVWLYPGSFSSESGDRFGGATLLPTPLFTSRGYAVLACDAPIGPAGQPGQPLQELVQVIEPQIREAARLGLIDPERVAVMGHSHGGYAVAALLSGSKLFRAGVAMCGLYDLGAMYSNEEFAPYTYISGQMRMGVPLWSEPERYRANSPYYLADHIQSPLLLLAGELDVACPYWEASKLFYALQSLHKPCELAIYPGEEHVPTSWSAAHLEDACTRVLDFLALQLKGRKPAN